MLRAPHFLLRVLVTSASLVPLALAHGEDPSPVTGTILDARTRSPLPRYTLELRAGTRADRVISDDKGRFQSAISFLPGDVSVRAIDDDSVEPAATDGGLELPAPTEAPFVVRFAGAPLEIAVPVGPTFQLKWKARDDGTTPAVPATSFGWLLCTAPEKIDEGVARKASVRIETDGRSWIRFAPLPPEFEGCAGSARLRIVSVDGKWMAEADVASAHADPAQPVELAWRPCARWQGVLNDGQGHAVAGTWLVLERLGEKGGVHERRRTRSVLGGGYQFQGLEPGQWRLRGDPLRFQPFQSVPRTLAGGEVSKLTISLDPERDLAAIDGRIDGAPAVEGASALPDAAIVVRRAGDRLPQETVRAAWKVEKGVSIALFTVPNLPPGEYDLELVTPPGESDAWVAAKLRAKPGTSVVFVRR